MQTQQVREMILKELPILLNNDDSFLETMLDIARPHFANKVEMKDRFNEIIAQLDHSIDKQTSVIEKLEQRLDQKIEEDRKRFEKVEQRLDQKIEADNQKFAQLTATLEKVEQRHNQKIEEDHKRFEKLERRLDQKIEEDRKRFEKVERRLDQKIEEDRKRFEKVEQRLDQKIEADNQKFAQLTATLEKVEQRLNQKIEEDRKWREEEKEKEKKQEKEHDIQMSKFDQRLMAMGARWGVNSEASFRNGLAAILEEFSQVEVIHVDEHDDDGVVFGYPEEIELDLIIKNGVLIIAEIKSATDKHDVYFFDKKVRFYEQKHGQKANRKLLISPMVEDRALPVAKKLGVEIYSFAQEVNV